MECGGRTALKIQKRKRMSDQIHLGSQCREDLIALFQEHLPGVEVWAYGSRVNGRSHEGSYLDLVLRGPGLTEIPMEQLVGLIFSCWVVPAPSGEP